MLNEILVPITESSNTSVGDRLKFARVLTGLSRREVSEKYGISHNSLSSVENNRLPLSQKSLYSYIDYLSKEGILVDEKWILEGKGKIEKAEQAFPFDFSSSINELRKDTFLLSNLDSLKNNSPHHIIYTISKESIFEPFVNEGDILFAELQDPNTIYNKKNCFCIIENTSKIKKPYIVTASSDTGILLFNPKTPFKLDSVLDINKINRFGKVTSILKA